MKLISMFVAAAAVATSAFAEPAVGDRMPASFLAKDSAGKSRQLDSLAGPNGLVLVLVRSAGWCPYCQVQLKELAAAAAPLRQKGYGLAAMSYDAPEVLAKFGTRQSIPYPLLSDSGSKMIDSLGLRDQQYAAGHMAAGVPLPTVLVVDPAGRIVAIDVSRDYRKRPSTAAVIAMAPAKAP